MQFLSLYTPIVSDVQPSADKLAAVGRLMQGMTRSGKHVATGGLGRRATGAFAITLKSGAKPASWVTVVSRAIRYDWL